MIVEISSELLVEMLRTDTVIRSIVTDGIPRDYHLVNMRVINAKKTIELLLHSPTDQGVERKEIMLTDLRGT